MSERFTEILRAASEPAWSDAVGHRFDRVLLWLGPSGLSRRRTPLRTAVLHPPTLGELAASGTITADTARFFGPGLRLHRHQAEALAAASRGENYIVSL